MKSPRLNPESHALLQQIIAQYQPKSVNDIQEMLKSLFADTMEDMLKAELDTELGYKKNSQETKSTDNRRNGSYPKKLPPTWVKSSLTSLAIAKANMNRHCQLACLYVQDTQV